MPKFDKTGPMGQGSQTGRKMGRCSNNRASLKNQSAETKQNTNENMPENIQRHGLGLGRKRGGRGFGRDRGQQNRYRSGF